MIQRLLNLLILPSVIQGTTKIACPGSPSWQHAKCNMVVTFPSTSCTDVHNEIASRIAGLSSWIDPHNGGTYSSSRDEVDESTGTRYVEGSHDTGDGKYTDKFTLVLMESSSSEVVGEDSTTSGSCTMTACSESQVTSVLDFSTNYCNLRNLYCNSDDGCPIVNWDLEHEEKRNDCWQSNAKKCIVSKEATFAQE